MRNLYKRLINAGIATAQKIPKLRVSDKGKRDLSKVGLRKHDGKIIRTEDMPERQYDPDSWIETAQYELEQKLGVSTEIVGNPEDSDDSFDLESVSGPGSNNESEWLVCKNDDAATRIAEERVADDLENRPEMFSQSFLEQHLSMGDTDRRLYAQEEADNLVDDVYDDEQILDESGAGDEIEEKREEIQDEIDALEQELEDLNNVDDTDTVLDEIHDKDQELEEFKKNLEAWEDGGSEYEAALDKAKEEVRSDKYDEIYEDLSDPIQYFVHDHGVYENAGELLKRNPNWLDIEEAAEDAVSTDGVDHFLDGYDGSGVELDSGAIAYGTN